MKNKIQVEIKSEKVQNIIGQIPPILLRYGTAIIFLSLLVLIFIASIIPYKHTIDTTIMVQKTSDGVLRYTAHLPYKKIDECGKMVEIKYICSYKLPLPTVFKIDSMSNYIYIDTDSIWQVAYLSPIQEHIPNIRLLDSLILPASIVLLPEQSVLSWLLGK